jgi:1-acyl-sn-glycerol-3-phosphate acyltransferase
MIKAEHHWFLYPFFEMYGEIRLNLHFKRIFIEGKFNDRGLPLLVIPNHFSWWDGFLISSLNRKVFHKKFHVMMLEEQLKKNIFLRKTGAFSIKRSHEGIKESMLYTIGLLQNPENMVAFFPQGQFESSHQEHLHFKKGLTWILKNLKTEIQIIFVANLTEYFEYHKPRLFICFKEYFYIEQEDRDIEQDYNNFYKKCIKKISTDINN